MKTRKFLFLIFHNEALQPITESKKSLIETTTIVNVT